MNNDKIFWLAVLPISSMIVAPSIIGAGLVKYTGFDYLNIATVVGGMMIFGLPIMIFLGWKHLKNKRKVIKN